MEGYAVTNTDSNSILPSEIIYELELLPSSAPSLTTFRAILPKSSVTFSSSQPTESASSPAICNSCGRTFKTERGLKQHAKKCKQNITEHAIARDIPVAVADVEESRDEPLVWGSYTMADIELVINSTYDEIVHWRRNIFMLPSGAAGKSFIRETTRLLELWTNDTNMNHIALKALMIMPALLLQKPSFKSTAKENSLCLQRRLVCWENGQFDVLMSECRAIQKCLKNVARRKSSDSIAKTFAKHMLRGNIKAAIRLLDQSEPGGVLPLTCEVF